jgi:Fe2+ transport system protein FeoA
MKLTEAKDGQQLEVIAVDGQAASLQALRFGIDAGSKITVQKNISGGPVIISKNQLEIAIGREIALAISVVEAKAS